MRLTINYGVEREVDRVFYTLHKYEWYQHQGYKVFLPEGVTIDSTREEVRRKIEELYLFEEYEAKGKELVIDFEKYAEPFSQALKTLFSRNVPEAIELILTKYGVGGSYRFPKTVLFNLQYTVGVENLFHEVMHLCIEPYIKKYSIGHWEKERIVDLILHSKDFAFLNYTKWQGDYQGVEKIIDPLFNTCYPLFLEYFFNMISKSAASHLPKGL